MRIIKLDENEVLFLTLAGEILNVEAGLQHYIDGVPVQLGKTISKADYVGYPSFTLKDGVRFNIKAACGYIYVPVGTDITGFAINLDNALKNLEPTMKRLDRDETEKHMHGYHTFKSSYNTSVKIPCDFNETLVFGAGLHTVNYAREKGPKRIFLQDEADSTRGRFTWFIVTIDKIDFTISSTDPDRAIWRFASSIFWDRDDISKCEHNNVLFDFNRSMIQGSEAVVDENITLFRHSTNPLLVDLNKFWKDKPHYIKISHGDKDEKESIWVRNIRTQRLFRTDFASIKIRPVKIGTGLEVSTDVCASCKCLLYDDFYALNGDINDSNDNEVYSVAVCPLCMHASPDDMPLELKYIRIFRVKCPRSIADMIEISAANDDAREIRMETLKGVQELTIKIGSGEIKYMLFGDKYAAFTNIDHFLFTGLSKSKELAGRKVCIAKMIEW